MAWLILGFYFISLIVIFCYALLQLTLAFNYLNAKKRIEKYPLPTKSTCTEKSVIENFPYVTIQLPIYNEKYVIDRLIESVINLNYPSDKLQIQVLDDSTDETTRICEEKIKELQKSGINIELIRRNSRVGFKAGALDYGLKTATGEFIAVFDADFIVDPAFLENTIPYFADSRVGVVQTRWEHINRYDSLLTKLQAFALDAHFSVEQVGRSAKGHFINFNGTAGIWRNKTISDAGGWEHDTLTEDLDLSYRAQLKGWKFIYKEDVPSPAELPVTISALKNQQFRWVKGGAENFKKMAGRLITTKKIRFSDRIHGLGHLFNSSVYLFVFTTAILTVPLVFALHANPEAEKLFKWMALFFISTLFLMVFYWVSYREKVKYKGFKIPQFIFRFFQFLTVSLGLSFYNTQGIIQAYMGKKSAFIRTPKFNSTNKKEWKKNTYNIKKIKTSTFIEGLLSIYFAAGMIISFIYGYYGMIPFQLMLTIGFGLVFIYTLIERK